MKTSRNKSISNLLGNIVIAGFLLFFSFVSVVNAETFNITSTAGANGTISPAGLTVVNEGGSQVYDITPDVGYDIDTLTVDGVSITPSATYQFDNTTSGDPVTVTNHTVDVTFADITAPVITAPIDQTFEATGPLTTPTLVLATATDTADPAPVITSDVTDFQLGTTLVTWTATDASGNTATTTSNVTITDTTAPTVTLIGPSNIYVLKDSVYTDPGAEAFDLVDQVLTSSIIIDTSLVDTATLGTYNVAISVSDTNGNSTMSVRTVNVVDQLPADTTAPVITMLGVNPTYVIVGSTYTDAGATALDDIDQVLTGSIVVSSNVDTNTIGSYTVVYDVTDSSGNTATATRNVEVVDVIPVDTTAPVITLNGVNPTNVLVNSTYTDAGVTVVDDTDGVLTPTIVSTVDTSIIGAYTVTYTATDLAGNTATLVRDVNVVATLPADTTAPVITITGTNPINILQGSVYADAGATALDDIDGILTVTSVSTVDTAILGSYTVTYTATDSSGNVGTAVRTVDVVASLPADVTAPVITLTGANPLTVAHGSTFVEPGFTATDDIDGLLPNASITVTSNVNMMLVGTYTITYTATDSSGNTANLIRTVNVTDQTPPVLTAPVDQTFEATGISTTPVLVQAAATDAVDPSPIITVDTTSFALGTTTVTWTATDAAGNSSTVTSLVTIVDTTAPTITAPVDQTFEATGTTTTPTLAQATATDLVDPAPVITVDTTSFALGTTTVTWTATDANGNSSTVTSNVIIVDTTAPTITVTGTNPLTISAGTTYTDAGATATDIVDGTVVVTTSGTVNVNALGTYTITYTATDTSGNTSTVTRAVTVIDTTAPVITLTGANPFNVAQNTTYTDPGSSALDNIDGVVSVTNDSATSVDTSVLGTYTVTYTATDASGNTSTRTRSVIVTNTLIPVITMNGANPINIAVNATYNDPGATALDDIDGVRPVTTVSTVNTLVVGTYTVTYTATDTDGNTATAVRTVNVTDTIPPVINILGVSAISVALNGVYTDAGATATDNIDGSIPVTTVSTVDTSTAGVYTVTYTATDSSGNTSTAVRTVTVTTSTGPVITLNGANPLTVSALSTYTDPGATAFDLADGVVAVVTLGTVDTSTIGTYTITYTATDSTGNVTTATRTVNVVDNVAPVIKITGTNPVNILVGGTFHDNGATANDAVEGRVAITKVSNVNTAVAGTYTVTYSATDSSGNTATAVRTVYVTVTLMPVINITGGNTISVYVGSTYTDQGATATDDVDGTIPVTTVSSNVDTSTIGTYTVMYSATDSSANTTTATRTVNVIAVPPPTPPKSSGGGGGAGGAGMFIGGSSGGINTPVTTTTPDYSSYVPVSNPDISYPTIVLTPEVSYQDLPPQYYEQDTTTVTEEETVDSTQPTAEDTVVATNSEDQSPIENAVNTVKEKVNNVYDKVIGWFNSDNDKQSDVAMDSQKSDNLKADAESSNAPFSKKIIILAIILLAVGGIMEFNLYRAGSKKIVESQISSDTTIEPPKKFPINKSEPTEPPVDEIKDLFDDK